MKRKKSYRTQAQRIQFFRYRFKGFCMGTAVLINGFLTNEDSNLSSTEEDFLCKIKSRLDSLLYPDQMLY